MPVAATAGGTDELTILAVLLGLGALLVVSARVDVPYPILLVVGGAGLAFLPGVDSIELAPDLVLVAFLPPLLYSAAFFSSLQDLRAHAGEISLLAIGLVAATTAVVGVVAHAVAGLPWAAAFALGAIVSPTDPIAAVEIAQRVRAPRRLITIVEGESLVNDATGLIAYKFAVAAVLTGSFSASDAVVEFLLGSAGGVAIGLAVGMAVGELRRRLDDPPVEITISLITPYVAYLPAEAAGASAVLAAVTSGLYLGWHSPELITPATRIQAFAFWEIFVFALNAILFVLIGTQVHQALEALGDRTTLELVGLGVLIPAVVTATRMLWVFPFAKVTGDPPKLVALLGWTGMRGAVALAAALALPSEIPDRDLLIYLTFCVIVFTVVFQGLTLPWLIDRMRLYDDEETVAEQEARARLAAAEAALVRLGEMGDDVPSEVHAAVVAFYERRRQRALATLETDGDEAIPLAGWGAVRRKVIAAERAEVIRLRNRGLITDDIMRRVERDLDLEHARLEGA